MDAPHDPSKNWWVLSFLVTADEDGVAAVTAEHHFKTVLWEDLDGPQPIASTVGRFRDLGPAEQDQWRLAWRREAED